VTEFFRNRWWVVFASICGLLVGAGPVNVFAFAVFLKPVTESLGVGRELFSSGLIVGSTVAGIGLIPLGFLLDHYGVRRVMMPGLVLYAAGVMGYALMTPSPLHIYLAFAIAALFGPIGSPLPYGAVLSSWFDRQRGLAIGIAMAGVGLGVALVPQIAAVLIRLLGWRLAYVALGGVILLVAWVPVTLFVREPSERDAAAHADVAVEHDLPGLTLSEALFGSWRFWALTVAFFTAIAAINGTLTHIVALLTDRGVPLKEAIGTLSGVGIALILGRVLSGWCLDRVNGVAVAIVFFLMPMTGIALLASGLHGAAPFVGAALCGLGVGAEVDLMAFFVGRYFGLRAYSRIYGVMFAAFALANGIGPSIAGWSFDRFHSYRPAFAIFGAMLALTCLLLAPLGRYPYPARKEAPETPMPTTSARGSRSGPRF
jgi:MFS family permease